MLQSNRSAVVALAIASLALLLAAGAWWEARTGGPGRAASGGAWLLASPGERNAQVERHFRGLDVAMMEVGYRFAELYFAGMDGNWPYAKYQAEKIDLA